MQFFNRPRITQLTVVKNIFNTITGFIIKLLKILINYGTAVALVIL